MKSTLKVFFVVSTVSFLVTLIWWSKDNAVTKVNQGLYQITSPNRFQNSYQITSSNQFQSSYQHTPFQVSTHNDSTTITENRFLGCSLDSAPSKRVRSINTAKSFVEALNQTIDNKNNVILSIVDYGVREFAVNFYVSSVLKLNFTNHLFVCADQASQVYLSRCDIPCFIFHSPFHTRHFVNSSSDSPDFGSSNYQLKTNMKTRVVLDALIYGYNVLISDIDVIILKDPFPAFICTTCDVHVTMDRVHYNSGFVYSRSTLMSIKLYQVAWHYYMKYHKSHDQAYFNMAVQEMKNNDTDLAMYELPTTHFPCGYYYFRSDFRMFNNSRPCTNCVIIHNNYIGSAAAKKYRFKENLLWHVDSKNYYSNPNEKFITYENPLDFGQTTFEMETQALKSAMMLGEALGRKVILPTFRCCNCKLKTCDHPKHKCSLLSLVKLNAFDKEYYGKYREHVYLWNNMVPKFIRNSKILKIHLNITNENSMIPVGENVKIFNKANIFSTSDVRQRVLDTLKPYNNITVLKFSALYGDFSFVLRPAEKLFYKQNGDQNFQCSDYDQWDVHEEFTDTRSVKTLYKEWDKEKKVLKSQNKPRSGFIYKIGLDGKMTKYAKTISKISDKRIKKIKSTYKANNMEDDYRLHRANKVKSKYAGQTNLQDQSFRAEKGIDNNIPFESSRIDTVMGGNMPLQSSRIDKLMDSNIRMDNNLPMQSSVIEKGLDNNIGLESKTNKGMGSKMSLQSSMVGKGMESNKGLESDLPIKTSRFGKGINTYVPVQSSKIENDGFNDIQSLVDKINEQDQEKG